MVTGARQQRYRRRTRAISAGQALVEFALITPVFFLVFFSIVEFALITASIGTFDFAARDGARVGAIFGPTDTSNIDTDPGPPSGSVTGILYTIQGHVKGLIMADTTEVEIFDADPSTGLCLSSVPSAPPVQVDAPGCQEEEYPIAGDWTIGSPTIDTWPSTSRNDSASNADFIGVRVWYQYTYVTGFVAGLGTNLTLSATSVQRIEPLTTNVQHRGSPVSVGAVRESSNVAAMALRRPTGSPHSPAAEGMVPPMWWRRGHPGGSI